MGRMTVPPARLVTTLPGFHDGRRIDVTTYPGKTLLSVRTDDALTVHDLATLVDDAPAVFPATWSRCPTAVSPSRPDSSRMGLDGDSLLWGRFDGSALHVEQTGVRNGHPSSSTRQRSSPPRTKATSSRGPTATGSSTCRRCESDTRSRIPNRSGIDRRCSGTGAG